MNRIKIIRTPGEMEYLQQQMKALGRQSLDKYLRTEIRKLEKKFLECPGCVTPAYGNKKKEFVLYVPDDTYSILNKISLIMQKPISSVIDDFFIVPLLLPEMA